MGLLLSVLIGCVGVLELLACLRHAYDGVSLIDEHTAPCLFYHHSISDNSSSHDCICSSSHSSQTKFPNNFQYKLENFHEYSIRIRNDLRYLGEFHDGTLSDCSTRDIFHLSRPNSRLSNDFEIEIIDFEESDEEDDLKNLKSRSCSMNKSLQQPTLVHSDNQALMTRSLDNFIETSNDYDASPCASLVKSEYKDTEKLSPHYNSCKNLFKHMNDNQNYTSQSSDKNESIIGKKDSIHVKSQDKTPKNDAGLLSISKESKKHQEEEIRKSDLSIQTTNDLLLGENTENKYSTSKNKAKISVEVQTSFEEKTPEALECSPCKFCHKEKENLNKRSNFSSFEEKKSITSGESEKSSNLDVDSEKEGQKTIGEDFMKRKSNWENKIFQTEKSFDEYVDAESEETVSSECRLTSPIKYYVPDAEKNHAFWVIY